MQTNGYTDGEMWTLRSDSKSFLRVYKLKNNMEGAWKWTHLVIFEQPTITDHQTIHRPTDRPTNKSSFREITFQISLQFSTVIFLNRNQS